MGHFSVPFHDLARPRWDTNVLGTLRRAVPNRHRMGQCLVGTADSLAGELDLASGGHHIQ